MTEASEGRPPWERLPVDTPRDASPAEVGEFAGEIAVGAGALLLDLFRGPLQIEFKDRAQRDPVSQADRNAEEYLRRAILARFPDHAILGEEGKDVGPADAPYTWVLDPLDGTTNYINGLPLFAVSVGVLQHGRPAAGAIWTPASPSGHAGLFGASRGSGASLDGSPLRIASAASGDDLPIPRRLAAVPGGFGVMLSFSGPVRRRPGEARTLGSIAVEAALVAAGVLQYAIFWSPKIWDVAAAATIVREAGGAVLVRQQGRWRDLNHFAIQRDKKGRPRPLRDWTAPVIVAAPPLAASVAANLHPTLLGRVAQVAQRPVVRRGRRIARLLWREFGPPRTPSAPSK
ncbi:MAG: inositol monophosphatase family protein [Dehalococcoidia bacterium]